MNNAEQKVDDIEEVSQHIESPNQTELILNSEKKGLAAISEVERRMKLDESVEENLSAGLDNNKNFVKKYKIIGNKRVLVIELLKNKIKNTIKESPEPFVFDEKMEQAMKELEEQLNDPFARYTYNNLSEINKRVLLDHLVDNSIHPNQTEIVSNANNNDVINIVSEANDNVVSYSDNGYLVQLANKKDLKPDTKIEDKACLYNLISPDGKTVEQNIDYASVMTLLAEQSENYHQKLREDFNLNNKETALNEESSQLEVEVDKPEIIIIELDKEEEQQHYYQEAVAPNPLNEKVSKYAESIGIKPEELNADSEFLNLSPEQQQFTLETLRRTALAKAKVEAHQTFTEEKSSKKWWQIGFAINQNYHKERHKIEAVKNIEGRGLEGYGQEDLKWLSDIVKNGPEIKMNEKDEVIVNFLKEEDFGEEEKEKIAEYNRIAREYIEFKPKKGERDVRGHMANKMDDIYVEIMEGIESRFGKNRVNELFLKSRNNIELLRFLSADKETEVALNKLAETSTEGFDRIKGMALGQADKAGYSALGFAIRSGSKFALANSAVLASALSYSVAPIAASIVGGFRAYNKGKNELKEKEELANLGIEDKSGLVRGKNLATGSKEEEGRVINFGLKEKLETLVEQTKNYNLSEEEYFAIIEKLVTRINYTELKMNRNEIDYGPTSEININYSNLINTISEAKSVVGLHRFDNLHRKRSSIYSAFDDGIYSAFSNVNSYNSKIKIPERLKDESLENYKVRLAQDKNFVKYQSWATDEKRLEKLGEASLALRLNSFLKLQERNQTKKEEKYLLKKVASGALMGAGFAAVGAFVADHLSAKNFFDSNSGVGLITGASASNNQNVDMENINMESVVNEPAPVPQEEVETPIAPPKTVETPVVTREEIIPVESLETPAIEEIKTPVVGVKVSEIPEINTDEILSSTEEVGEAPVATIEQVSPETISVTEENISEVEMAPTDAPVTQEIVDLPVEVETPETPAVETVEEPYVADKMAIAEELHTKPEALEQVGSDLVYKGAGKSNLVFDLKVGGIKEAVDVSGKKIPKEFIDELIDNKKLSKFTRGGGLEKIFNSWDKLNSNDKLVYESFGWFNKKIMNPTDLLTQIRGIYHVDTDKVFIDSSGKQFITSSGKQFDMTLKGVKKLIAFLPKK